MGLGGFSTRGFSGLSEFSLSALLARVLDERQGGSALLSVVNEGREVRVAVREPLGLIGAVGVVTGGLGHGVENAEVGLGVDAGAGGPLPTTIVTSGVVIGELTGEVALAPAPVDMQQLSEEAGDDHAPAVMHVARLVKLPHGGIDNREASAAVTPGLEV